MSQILVVDDDTSFLMSLTDALSNEDHEVLTAGDGKEALEVLQQRSVDLVVTDIKMPRMDGIKLVGEIVNLQRPIPCIVMTAFGTPELEGKVGQLGALEFIDKPIDLGRLRRLIREVLEKRLVGGYITGLNLPSFLQLLSVEKKTCTVEVSKGGARGLLYFRKGVLLNASLGDKEGEGAAYELLAWDGVEIAIQNKCAIKKRTIEVGLQELLLETMRRCDENRNGISDVECSYKGGDEQVLSKAKEVSMSLEKHLDDFKEIKGYIASAIMDFTGDALATHSTTNGIDLEATGAVFNDIFRSAHEASGKVGLEACTDLVITTPKGMIVMECSGVNSSVHIHFIVVLEQGGNQALVRTTFKKVVPAAVAEMG